MKADEQRETLVIKPMKFGMSTIAIRGTAPLVIHRFSAKTKSEMEAKREKGSTPAEAKGRNKVRGAVSNESLYEASRYISPEGWDGFHAAAIRNAMIAACRVTGIAMTMARMTVFVVQDGWDEKEPQVPLVRIHGEPVMQTDMARTTTGEPIIAVRAAYHDWLAKVTLRWDDDQLHLSDICNLLQRAGAQVGIGEGRPFSKKSAGMGWGTFELVTE